MMRIKTTIGKALKAGKASGQYIGKDRRKKTHHFDIALSNVQIALLHLK